MSRCFDPEIYLLCRFYWIKQRKKFDLKSYPIVNDYYYVHIHVEQISKNMGGQAKINTNYICTYTLVQTPP